MNSPTLPQAARDVLPEQRIAQHPVFVLGSLYPALGTVHVLTAQGVVCWVCCWERGVASWSRHARYVRISDPRLDERAMVEQLCQLARKVGGRPVLIPTDDHYAQALARNRDELSEVAICCVAASETVELLVSQQRFCEWGVARGISCPKAAPADACEMLEPPLVAKPINKSTFRVIAHELDVAEFRFKLLRNQKELDAYRKQIDAYLDHVLLQEFIDGNTADMYSIGVYADQHSRILGFFVGRKVRGYPAMYGNTKVGQNDTIPPHVLDEIARVVDELSYTGIAEFEYRKVPATGEFRLIEINPRCWSWIGATAMSDANIPWIAYQDLIGVALEPVVDNAAPGKLKYVQIMSDCANVFLRYRWDHPAWLMRPRAWWDSLKAEQRMIVEFHRGDWPVACVCFGMLVRNAGLLALKRLKLRS